MKLFSFCNHYFKPYWTVDNISFQTITPKCPQPMIYNLSLVAICSKCAKRIPINFEPYKK